VFSEVIKTLSHVQRFLSSFSSWKNSAKPPNLLLQHLLNNASTTLFPQGRIAQEREYAKLIDTANAPIFGVDAAGVSLTMFADIDSQFYY